MKNTEKFFWGSSTASYQCEGAWNEDGKAEGMWDTYLHENNYENGDVASDHYHHYEEDIRLLAESNQNAYRFSLSWPRIIKNRNGEINTKGIDHYNKVIDTCIKYDVEPFVTIYHYDLPQYWEEVGGWLNPDICEAYLHYANTCFEAFGDRVTFWATFNEPKYISIHPYLIGNYPPEHHSVPETMLSSFHVMYASALATRDYRAKGYQGKIGMVHSWNPVEGIDDSIETQIAMRHADNFYNNWVLDTAVFGEFPIDLVTTLSKEYDISFMTPEKLRIIKNNTVDWIGLNYYYRALVKPYVEGETMLSVNNAGKSKKNSTSVQIKGWFTQYMDPKGVFTDWDFEIIPQSMKSGLIHQSKKYNVPIYVTENGVGCYEELNENKIEDTYRIEFMNDHIAALIQAQKAGADVRGYFAWSTFDIYSWKNGHEKRYGLVGVDFNTLKRYPKASYYWYKEMIKANASTIDHSNIK
ncbi:MULTISPECIES: glycoside hydrolase family 1 protein [unclassified Breznakia]|uniref:glycoside hydrolase family 1 protein n=1 Tax=unclassified Breznakia TaxID=2623764 RepID=UPI002475C72E|nr:MULTISPECIES: glycoside hydrolase family 1 protein [unclassified Breznakia]MDH6366560.1 beta-glucosidase/6-phospho-beta-glucosidase/beta-galactosidase [Breznakia sp. PH1-1]MDH6403653.1 beta-glucosidase/6-phospho-beta-glucosidase/beta-galactosidase [Breznakia sp. PF1-11]MDH6411362.1 beta-glucosidase/6-phospho-beta-glucosidase/beta-galactosidase [Breznakia sp. PFB1-11]MDH6413662.1 beta-glucosidase/6-phospho-beta-glucosidase/beta-galactosidase [Breznakia sp. PFB1-14]MDH6415907.1 beta-glucosida